MQKSDSPSMCTAQTIKPVFTLDTLENRELYSASPIATDDQLIVSQNSTAVLINHLILNDTDADNDSLNILNTTQPTNGVITENGGDYYYQPNAGYAGDDMFEYTVTDGNGNESQATVELSVNVIIDGQAARNMILNGVSQMQTLGDAGRMSAYGSTAFTITEYPDNASEGAFVAAASMGLGRVVALPDASMVYMDSLGNQGDMGQFYKNSLQWLTKTTSKNIRIVTSRTGTRNWLASQGYTNVTVSSNYTTALTNADVLVAFLGSSQSQENLDAISSFVKSGKGLLIADHGGGRAVGMAIKHLRRLRIFYLEMLVLVLAMGLDLARVTRALSM